MTTYFKTLFTVKLHHAWYTSGLAEDIAVAPTPACRRKLQRYGLLFRAVPEGFLVLYEARKTDTDVFEPARPFDDDMRFTFVLTATNPAVLRISDLPLNSAADQVYYLHNLHGHNGPPLPLTFVSDKLSRDDSVPLRKMYFRRTSETDADSLQVEVRDNNGQPALNQVVSVRDGMADYAIDLRDRPPGLYSLFEAGVKQDDFYADDTLFAAKPFGIVEIFNSADLAETPHEYEVKILRRKTHWQYRIIHEYDIDEEPLDLEIANGNGLTFNDQTNNIYLNPNPAPSTTIFLSGAPVELKQEPRKGITLSVNDTNINNLPNPGPNTSIKTGKLTIDNTITYSEIFLYV